MSEGRVSRYQQNDTFYRGPATITTPQATGHSIRASLRPTHEKQNFDPKADHCELRPPENGRHAQELILLLPDLSDGTVEMSPSLSGGAGVTGCEQSRDGRHFWEKRKQVPIRSGGEQPNKQPYLSVHLSRPEHTVKGKNHLDD